MKKGILILLLLIYTSISYAKKIPIGGKWENKQIRSIDKPIPEVFLYVDILEVSLPTDVEYIIVEITDDQNIVRLENIYTLTTDHYFYIELSYFEPGEYKIKLTHSEKGVLCGSIHLY